MPVTPEQIQHIAALARLTLSQTEASLLSFELSSILDYVAQIQQVTATHAGRGETVVVNGRDGRDDIVQLSLASHEALMNAPRRSGDYFLVPRVIG